jgi:hypothetical protein
VATKGDVQRDRAAAGDEQAAKDGDGERSAGLAGGVEDLAGQADQVAGALATVDVHELACDERRRLQLHDRADDIGRLTHASHRLQRARAVMSLRCVYRLSIIGSSEGGLILREVPSTA